MIPHNKIEATREEADAVASVVMSGYWAAGPATEKLERELAGVCGREHCTAVASGLSALRLALLGADVKQNDRVGVPAYSCVALPNAVLSLGAEPVALDCDPETLNVSAEELESNADELSCAILVNTFGHAATFPDIPAMLIEDCSHGFGHGRLGHQGEISMTSLYATKFLGSGRGGAVLSDDPAVADRIRDLRDYNDKPSSHLALNEMPDDLNSALASVRLGRLSAVITRRAELASRYQSAFSPLAGAGKVALPPDSEDRVWYRYVLRTKDAQTWIERLAELGVQAAIPVTNWLDDQQQSACPNAAAAYREVVSLPIYPSLTDEDQDAVIAAVVKLSEQTQ